MTIYSGLLGTVLLHTCYSGLIINSTLFTLKRVVFCTVNYIVTLSVVRLPGLNSGTAIKSKSLHKTRLKVEVSLTT